jgi:hypothetical protein
LACPFFMPTRKYEDGAWTHPARLPLGSGWRGHCTAPGHEGEIPEDDRLRDHCNLGYVSCPNSPPGRVWDSIRFAVVRECEQQLTLRYVCERNHRPAEHGCLEYDNGLGRWLSSHSDVRIQQMANCYVQSYRERNQRPGSEGSAS